MARSFIWGKQAGHNRVRKLVLVASPSLGATKPYCFLKKGIPVTKKDDPELFDPVMLAVRVALLKLVTINPLALFDERKIDVAFLRGCFAMHELSVKRLYARHENISWLTFKPADTGLDTTAALVGGRPPQTGTVLLNAENTDDVYNDPALGFTDFPFDRNSPLWRDRERSLRRFDGETMVFDSAGVPVRAKFHRDTTFFASSSHKTHNEVDLQLKKVKRRSGENSFVTKLESKAGEAAGDFSVPIGSALPKPNIRFPNPGKAKYREKSINALHEGMCNHRTVIKLFTKLMVQQCEEDNKAGP